MKEIRFGRRGQVYGCFSNFHECGVLFDGIMYRNSEAAWQAQKTLDVEERKEFSCLSGSEAKKKGNQVRLRKDWEKVKVGLMEKVCYAKFSQNARLEKELLSTGDSLLIENTTGWHDNFWGDCSCPECIDKKGQNHLGKALMAVRTALKDGKAL